MTAIEALCMACDDSGCSFRPLRFQRRPLGDDDVLIDMKFCGVCHSDVAWAKGEAALALGSPVFPAVPGHELAGVVEAVGKNVVRLRVGDHVGVGCMVDSCLNCKSCRAGNEHECSRGFTGTYGGKNSHGRAAQPGGVQTKGGYCTKTVVDHRFCILVPKSYPLESAGPMMCAGITVYSPMKKANIKQGSNLAVVGLGGLGLTAIKIGKALGAKVTAVSRSEAKRQIAVDAGADSYVAMANVEQTLQAEGSFDLIINTIPSNHNWEAYMPLLNESGKHVLLGLHNSLIASVVCDGVSCGKCPVTFSAIGSIRDTQAVIDLADKSKIIPVTKLVSVSEINRIFEMQDAGNDAGVRYVLDIANTLKSETLDSISCGIPPKLATHTDGIFITGIVRELVSMAWKYILCRSRRSSKKAKVT